MSIFTNLVIPESTGADIRQVLVHLDKLMESLSKFEGGTCGKVGSNANITEVVNARCNGPAESTPYTVPVEICKSKWPQGNGSTNNTKTCQHSRLCYRGEKCSEDDDCYGHDYCHDTDKGTKKLIQYKKISHLSFIIE